MRPCTFSPEFVENPSGRNKTNLFALTRASLIARFRHFKFAHDKKVHNFGARRRPRPMPRCNKKLVESGSAAASCGLARRITKKSGSRRDAQRE
jgi:hypothetical protein